MTQRLRPSRPTFGRRLLAGTLATLFALLLAELALRVANLPRPSGDFHHLRSLGQNASWFVPDPELHWLMAPGDPLEPANQFGLRGPMPSGPRLERDFVVFCVGDSCTFGAGVRYDDTYGARLGLALQRAMPDRRVDVVLAALGGFSSHQDLVLFQRLLEHGGGRLRPDVTILYTGLFNDYTPAIGSDDLQRAHPPWLHLQRLFEKAQESEAEIKRVQDEFVHGKHVEHPRVPIEQYRRNVEAIAEQARALGSRVVSLLPPRTPRMFAIYRDGHDYAAATRSVADALSLPIVEPMTRFEAFEAQIPQGLRDVDDPWPCFVDVGHPSVLGHELIAEQLFEVMRDQLALAALAGPAATIPTMEVRCERRELRALRPGILELTTPRARQIDRAWLGDRWIPGVTALDDGHLQLELPELLDPGEYALDLRTTTGLSHTNLTFEVTPLALHSRFERRDDGGIDLFVDGEGPAGFRVGVWIQPGLRAVPRATRFGPLRIDVTAPGDDRAPPRAPYRFERLPPWPLTAQVGADSRWSAQVAVPKETALPDRVFLQAFLTDTQRPWFGALSAVAELELR